MRCGRAVRRCRLTSQTPTRVARSACGFESPGSRRRLVGLAVAFSGGHRLTHHPFASFSGGAAVRFRVRLGVTRAPVTARSCRISRPIPGTASPASHTFPALLGPTPDRRRRACGRTVSSWRRAPLLRFSGPFSACWPRRVLVRWAAGPPGPSRFGVTPRHPRRSRNGPCRETRPCGFALFSSGCEVEVLGAADERGWAFRPDRVGRGMRSTW